MNTLQGIIFSILIALGVVQMTPPVQEPILGADSTINRLELWTATTTPQGGLTPRTFGRGIYMPYGTVTTSKAYITDLFVDTCTGTGCGSGSGSDDLEDVSNRGASATATLTLLGGFISASSSVTSTLNVWGTMNALAIVSPTATIMGKGVCLSDGTYCAATAGSSNANFWTYDGDADFLSPVTSTTAVSSSNFIVFQDSDNQSNLDVSGFSIRVAGVETTISDSGVITAGDVVVGGQSVCLANGTNCPASTETDTLLTVSNRGASATATLQLYGGFLASSSTVTSTFTVVGSTGLQAVTFTNATGSQVTSTSLYISGSASTTRLFANTATIGTATLGTSTVEGKGICLSDGSYCSPSGSEADTLATVTGRGSSTIQTLNLMGGFIAASSSVTSTFNVTGATTLANATATTLFTTSLKGTSSTITTIAATDLFSAGATSTALFATSFKATSSTIATLAAGSLFFENGTSTNLFSSGTASSSLLFANMATLGGLVVSSTTVCLSNGVGCLAASASAAGIVELATIAETSAGTDATRAVTPDGLSQSVFGSKTVELYLTTSTGALLAVNSASNTSTCFTVQPPLAGMVLTAAHVAHGVAGSGTTSTVVNIKTTSSLFLLSTPLYIDPGEYGSETAVTSTVINTSNDDVFAYQRLCADVQNVENTTPGKETILSMTFSLP